jgi:hypothetical protein
MVYDLRVEEEKIKPHQVTALHLVCAFAFIGAGAIIAVYNYVIPGWGIGLLAGGTALLGITIFKNKWIVSRKVNVLFRAGELVAAVWIAVYSATQQWKFPEGIFGALAAATLFAIYWESTAEDPILVRIDNEGIKLPFISRKRFLPWVEVEQVTLKFGTLSIDSADNHLYQWSVTMPGFDQEIFDAFCVAKVEENRGKRRNDEW